MAKRKSPPADKMVQTKKFDVRLGSLTSLQRQFACISARAGSPASGQLSTRESQPKHQSTLKVYKLADKNTTKSAKKPPRAAMHQIKHSFLGEYAAKQ